ncbi:hypothetical protein [Blastococcus sp. TF02A-35]|uniref:hypothetical protein n=1 Tax=Blastococcus sp. TF02A-35 TaxID=2559612 RepID=UPI0010739A03|nr:hypothetical protein [Blastococcus sp. TF02A_35]TFV46566.1 hypothetical protein E4P43_16325 [Blastococcus sp. TF02A_35]
MGSSTTGEHGAREPLDDPFVRQVTWLVDAHGGREQLARASGNRVSPRTLDNWCRGRYPRNAVTGAVRDLDAWALENAPGYPGAARAPRLVETCGPAAAPPVPERPAGPEPAPAPAPEPAPEPATAPAPWWRRRWPAVVAALLVLTTGGTTAALLVRDGAPDPIPPLPSTGDGRLRPETTGSLGANTFADPRTLQGQGQKIPPDTTVEVRCRYYAPSIPSVTPDGFWYLVDSGEWAGRWSPANSFMNGDVKGGRTLHNTDFDVPVCR